VKKYGLKFTPSQASFCWNGSKQPRLFWKMNVPLVSLWYSSIYFYRIWVAGMRSVSFLTWFWLLKKIIKIAHKSFVRESFEKNLILINFQIFIVVFVLAYTWVIIECSQNFQFWWRGGSCSYSKRCFSKIFKQRIKYLFVCWMNKIWNWS
jgi:hypothetical protein